MWQVVKVHPCGPTSRPNQITKLYLPNLACCAKIARVSTRRESVVFPSLSYWIVTCERQQEARAMCQDQCPITISLYIGKHDGEHVLGRLISGIAKQDGTFSPHRVPRASEGRDSRQCPETIVHVDDKEMGQGRAESPSRRIVVDAIVLDAS